MRSASRFARCVAFWVAVFVASLTARVSAQTPSAEPAPAPQRAAVLVPGGDPALAHALGPGVREQARAVLQSHDVIVAPVATDCSEADCATELLESDVVDLLVIVELRGRAEVCETVRCTIVVAGGLSLDAEAHVGAGGVPAAVESAVVAALSRAQGGTGGAQLTIDGLPEGAAITLDQRPWGTVPHVGTVTRGDHSITVSADGFLEETRQIVVGDQPVDLVFELRHLTGNDARVDTGLVVSGSVLGVLGLAGVGVGLYGFLAPPSLGSDGTTYDAAGTEGSAFWLGLGAAGVAGGLVMIALGVTSSAPASASSASPVALRSSGLAIAF